MRFYLTIVMAALCAEAQQIKPYLRIETGSHTAVVRRIDVDAAERYLVSASEDKTARVWDLKTGKLLSVLRPPIANSEVGKLYSVAISPDGSSVAVGGFTAALGPNCPIYIFDRSSGRIRQTITGLPQVANHLAYSKNGRFLAAAFALNTGIRVFDTSTYAEVARDASYEDSSYWVEFDETGKVLTTSYDGFVRLYGSDLRLLAKTKVKSGAQPFSARFSPDGKSIAVGQADEPTVNVLSAKDLSLRYVRRPTKLNGALSTVAWSANGARLCAGGGYESNDVKAVICWNGHQNESSVEYPMAANTILDLRSLRDGAFAFCSFDGTVGLFGATGADRWRATADQLQYGGPSTLRVAPDGNSVEIPAFGFSRRSWTRPQLFFSLSDRMIEKNGPVHASFHGPATNTLPINGWRDNDYPTLNGLRLRLERDETSRSLSIAPAEDSFVLGTDWFIHQFDPKGRELWKTSIPGPGWSVNIPADSRFVVAALGDGTIRWYTLDKGEEILALFVDHTVSRWVAWNPDGFFAFDGGGDALIGYHINRGPGQSGDFVKVDQLREVFYRPDLISQILKPGGTEAIVAARSKIGDLSAILSGGLPPEVELISSAKAEVTDDYLLEFRIKDRGRGRGRIVYRIDGAEIEGRDVDVRGTVRDTISRRIPIGGGNSTLEVAVYDAKGTILGPPQKVQLSRRLSAAQSNLYVVAAGVSHYRDHSLDGGVKFAAADADLVAVRFQEQQGRGLYARVSAVALTDRQATVANIKAEVEKARKSIQPGDTFVLYLSGHGKAVDGEYYFIPWEAEYTNEAALLKASLKREAIQELMKVPTNKSVLVLDTCDSGAIIEGRTTLSEKAAMEKIAKMSGRAVLAASNTQQMALDGYQNHGVFTYFFTQGLREAEANSSGEISVSRLAEFIYSRVPEVTEQRWKYRQLPLSRIEGEPFPIARKPRP